MADSPPLVATYRLQLTPAFGLADAAAIAPYLARLGISHVYTSSYLQAAAGSTHGYDTTDHSRVSDELGGEEALDEFQRALVANGLRNIIDVVPNHMSVADASANGRWWNVLRDGQGSPDAAFFDVDWNPPEAKLAGKILLPVLGRDYAEEIDSGALTVVAIGDTYEVRYAGLRFPVAAPTVLNPPVHSAAAVHDVLEQQHYRLASWRVGRDEINYRRFFDVTTLAGVRVEDPAVFAAVHARTLEWVRDGHVHGLRIDHPDGLRDPTGYLTDLRAAAPSAWITVEKILEPGEQLPSSWPVDGTTGYDAMRKLTALFVDPAGEPGLTSLFETFVGNTRLYEEQLIEAKRLVLDELFGAELTRLTDLAARLAEASVVARDFSRREVRAAITALLIAVPVYRTYVPTEGKPDARADLSAQDAAVIATTVALAEEREPLIDAALFTFLGSALSGLVEGMGVADVWIADQDDVDEFVARFQQLSGPAMAKGLEDTLFYRYNRLVALNEVGSDPSRFGMTVAEFHADMAVASLRLPLSMIATSTHDTKRSEDVRARLTALLSEAADEWTAALRRWSTMNEFKWGSSTPDRAMELLLYQTMFGSPGLSAERARRYIEKAVREAKARSSWLHPSDFEQTLFAFVDALAADPHFQTDLSAFVERFDGAARIASLSQLVLKATVPGIPDFYQGSELWTSSLVDPDNRCGVDYALRMRLLDAVERGDVDEHDLGSVKLWMTQRLLLVRRAIPGAFVGPDAGYEPLTLRGSRAADAIAFTRGGGVVVVAAIRPVALDRFGWSDTALTLPAGRWIDALDGSHVGAGGAHEGVIGINSLAHHGCVVLVSAGAPG